MSRRGAKAAAWTHVLNRRVKGAKFLPWPHVPLVEKIGTPEVEDGQAIAWADKGDYGALVRILRDEARPIDLVMRFVLAELIENRCKPPRGRAPKFDFTLEDFTLARASARVQRFKRVWAILYGRKRGVHGPAVAMAAQHYGLNEDKLYEFIRRGAVIRCRGATLVGKAGWHDGFSLRRTKENGVVVEQKYQRIDSFDPAAGDVLMLPPPAAGKRTKK
jgi:hypothetical protein